MPRVHFVIIIMMINVQLDQAMKLIPSSPIERERLRLKIVFFNIFLLLLRKSNRAEERKSIKTNQFFFPCPDAASAAAADDHKNLALFLSLSLSINFLRHDVVINATKCTAGWLPPLIPSLL
jgi:hypothetical protein